MISILMATYNGERFLCQQIDSILNQTEQRFQLFVRDDCSTDRTWEILQDYAARYPDKLHIQRNEINAGAKNNFLSMMTTVRDDYLMLCDQDDVWLPDKIKMTLRKMQELEQGYGKDVPILVHTDLRVVDGDLNIIHESFRYSMNANYTKTSLNKLLIQNTLTGCTALYNRSLAEKLTVTPEYCVMHDWWLILVASAFGKIGHIDEATILYRQHGSNEIGAKNVRSFRYKVNKLLHYSEIRQAIAQTYLQAESLLNAFRVQLSRVQIILLEEYCRIPQKNKIMRWVTICRLGVLKNGLARKIANFIFI